MRRKQLLFSKRDKAEKSTTMGEDNENQGGNLGLANNNSSQYENSNADISKQSSQEYNKNKNNGENTQIENVSNEVFNQEQKSKNKKIDLNQELEELKQKLKQERDESILQVNNLNQEDSQKNTELKKLTTKYNDMIQQLKTYEQNLVIKTRHISKYKAKTEEEIKKEIKVTEAQIKIFQERADYTKENYDIFKQKVEVEKNKENDLNTELTSLKEDISSKNQEIKLLKLTSNIHLNCNNQNRKLIERYTALNTAYKYEIKRAKQLALIEINEKDEDDQVIKEEYDKIDDKVKAEAEEKNILPKINVLKFRGENVQKLEMKIMKMNKIGVNKSNNIGNALNCYKKLDTEINENERYNAQKSKAQKRSDIKKNKYSEIKIVDNYLFNEKEEKVMEKVLPQDMYNSCKIKFNDILQQKKEIQEKLKTDSNYIKNENELIVSKCEQNNMELKTKKIDNLKLVLKSQKLRDKINNLKQNIRDLKKKIDKETEKLNNENKMNLYYKKLQEKQQEMDK